MSPSKFIFTLVDAEGEEIEVSLPARFEVCHRCKGSGRHVNEAIDGNGLTREDFDEDPDFEEAYFRGDYDVTCTLCHGDRVVSEVDEERLTESQREQYERYCESKAELARDEASERRLRMMEAGGWGW